MLVCFQTLARKSNLHSGGTTLVDLGAKEDASGLFGTSAVSSGTFCECNPSSDYDGTFHSNNKIEKCSQVEDKVVINETRIPTTVMNILLQEHYALVGLSSTSATEPHMIEYEQSDSGGCNDHCAAEKDEVTPETEIGNHEHSNDNYELSDLLASSGNMLPLFMESPSDCAVKHGGQVALKLCDEVSKHDFAKSEDNCYLETLLVNFHSKEDKHTSKNLPWWYASLPMLPPQAPPATSPFTTGRPNACDCPDPIWSRISDGWRGSEGSRPYSYPSGATLASSNPSAVVGRLASLCSLRPWSWIWMSTPSGASRTAPTASAALGPPPRGEGAAGMDTGPPEQHREVRSTVAGVGSPLEGLET
ncbi:hypothetical protein D1007_33441 [Hordeum vulgare]|nr:hypothetical protein D1007_33441 [Hordeum vulgare]